MNRAYRDYCRRRGAEMLRRQPPNFAPTLSAEELVVVYRCGCSPSGFRSSRPISTPTRAGLPHSITMG